MAEDADHARPMHPSDLQKVMDGLRDDLRTIMEATARGVATPPPAVRPPVDIDSFDERQFKRLKESLVSDVSELVRDATSRFVPDEEINDRLESGLSEIRGALDRFKGDILRDVREVIRDEIAKDRERMIEDCRRILHDEAENIFENFLPKKFALIGLRIDNEDKIEETRRMLDGMRQMMKTTGEFKSEAFRQIVRAFGWYVGIAVAAVLGFLGIKGTSH